MYIEKRERLKSRGRAKSNRARQGLNRFACTWKPPAHPSPTIGAVDFYLPVQDRSAHIPRLCRRRLCRMCTQVFKFSAPRTEYNAKESTRNGGPKGNDKRKERERGRNRAAKRIQGNKKEKEVAREGIDGEEGGILGRNRNYRFSSKCWTGQT